MIKMYICLHVKYPLFFQILMQLGFFQEFWKILMSDFVEIRPVETESFHTEGRTDGQT